MSALIQVIFRLLRKRETAAHGTSRSRSGSPSPGDDPPNAQDPASDQGKAGDDREKPPRV